MNADERKCPECAETIKKDANVCRFCGHRFRGGDPTDGPRNEAEQKVARNSKTGCAAAVVGIVFLVAFCSPDTPDDPGASQPTAAKKQAESEEDSLGVRSTQIMWVTRTKNGVESRLKDPDSANFKDVRFYSGGPSPAVCGQVNAKNSFGGYMGFRRFIGSGEEAVFLEDEVAANEFADAWNTLCVKADRDDVYLP